MRIEALSFRQFVTDHNPKFVWYRHCTVLADVLQRVADGLLKRVMVFMPPRHGKSELVSRNFPAYLTTRFPDRWTAMTSYSAELAFDLSRAARRNFGGNDRIAGETVAVKQWETGRGGGVWAAGVGGSATGKGFHVGLIDDPVKDAKEAASPVVQSATIDWYRSVFYTRSEPDAAIVICMTRWNEVDLAGMLLSEEGDDEEPEGWHIVRFPAIAEPYADRTKDVPARCTLEPDWRAPGEPLCPERYPLDKLTKIARRIGSYYNAALYQQRPGPKAGNKFKWAWFPVFEVGPAGRVKRLRYWDLAGTESDSADYTSGALCCLDEQGFFWVEDVVRGQWSPAQRELEMDAVAIRDRERFGAGFRWWVEADSGVDGKKRTQSLVRKVQGKVTIRTERPSVDKELRAEPLQAYAEAGNVRLVRGEWNHPVLTVLADFPYGKNDDDVDSIAGAFNKLVEPQLRAAIALPNRVS